MCAPHRFEQFIQFSTADPFRLDGKCRLQLSPEICDGVEVWALSRPFKDIQRLAPSHFNIVLPVER